MQNKCTTKNHTEQQLIAGILKKDSNIEFFGIHTTKTVLFMQNGQTHPFSELPLKALQAVVSVFESDKPAKKILHNLTNAQGSLLQLSYKRKLELYVYYCYGSLDGRPDVIDGKLQKTENFRESKNCISLGFAHKTLTINGKPLKPREVVMLDLFSQDCKDSAVAEELNIAVSTFNQHKRELLDKAGVMSKPALMIAALRDQIIN